MAAKTVVMTDRGPQKMPGWHSWRHQTRDAQDQARAAYQAKHGRAARQRRARERAS